MIKFGFFLK